MACTLVLIVVHDVWANRCCFFVHFTEKWLSHALVRLGNANIAGETPTNPVCGEIDVVDGDDVYELECNTEGRYLSVNLPGENYLTFCEVQIYTGECGKVILTLNADIFYLEIELFPWF